MSTDDAGRESDYLSAEVDPDLKQQVRMKAAEEQASMSEILRRAVVEYLD